MSTSDLALRALLVQKRSHEDEALGRLQAAQRAHAETLARRAEASEALQQLRAQQTPLTPGRRKRQELQREEALKKKAEDAGLTVARLLREEAAGHAAVAQAQAKFTHAAQERRSIEAALEESKRRQERARDQKQEEERDEAWRLLRTLRGVK